MMVDLNPKELYNMICKLEKAQKKIRETLEILKTIQFECPYCQKKESIENFHSEGFCYKCYNNKVEFCYHCTKHFLSQEMFKIDYYHVCKDCLEKYYVICCGDAVRKEWIEEDGEFTCGKCGRVIKK